MLHLTAIIVVPGCLALGWWQLHRALSGNALSWAYTIEWPFLAGYGVYMWWKILHEQPTKEATASSEVGAGDPSGASTHFEDDTEDDELAAYNRYLAELNEADQRKLR
ncbi:MAG: hypothetical protein ABSD97_13470 [Acidimicrobiales bacterium]|jgi:hypothetical protein